MSFVDRYYPSLVLLILAIAFYSRAFFLDYPHSYVFDEVYHAVTAQLIAQNNPTAFEWWNPPPEPNTAVDWLHPPLAKYTQAASILVFGESSVGWRFSSVVFGTGIVLLTILLTRRVFASKPLSLLAGILVSSDGLLLTLSRIAMNDIHATFFILLSVLTYTYYRRELALQRLTKRQNKPSDPSWKWLAISLLIAGLAASTKWSGVFAVGLIAVWEALFALREFLLRDNHWKWRRYSVRYFATALACVLIPAAVYLSSYGLMFMQGKDWQHLVDLHKQIWWYQTTLEATHSYQSEPWEWFLNLRPVWIYVKYISDTARADIYAFGNPALFWFGGAAVVAIVLKGLALAVNRAAVVARPPMAGRARHQSLPQALAFIKRESLFILSAAQKKNVLPVAFLLSAYCIVWLPWTVSPRIMFFYHYAPAVPFLAILLSWSLWKLWHGEVANRFNHSYVRALAPVVVVLCVLCFAIWYPHWVGIPTPLWLKETVYFALPSWK